MSPDNFIVNVLNIIWSFDKDTNQVLVLLVQNSSGPEHDKWGLPSTLLRSEENAEEASLRLIREKIGLNLPNFYTEQLATFSSVKRANNPREIALSYMTYLPSKPQLTPGYGAKDAQWFAVDSTTFNFVLNYANLSFKTLSSQISTADFYQDLTNDPNSLASDHALVLRTAFDRITNRLDYRPTILLILGPSFTLKEARSVYATFWKQSPASIDNSNFRKTHSHLFLEAGFEQGKSGRPAKLYKLR